MKVTILQTDIEWGNPQENIVRVERLVAQEPDSDLYVLPEMWSTGFATDPHGIAEEEISSIALQWMKTKANELHCAICGSLAIHVDGNYRNRHYFVDGRNGMVQYYDKHHLFSYGHEDQYYTPGDSHTVVVYEGFRFLLVTCYDLRFPVWSRYNAQYPYDAIICVANWPESRQNVWHTLLRARAIENQCYVIGCNRVGDDPNTHYIGHSAIIDSRGHAIAEDETERATTVTAEIDTERLREFREKFRVLADRDRFELKD